MSTPRVICLGEILIDCLADQLGKDVADVESWTPFPGGAPANVACALVKLGTPAAFIGCVGQDATGDELVQLLQQVGVNTSGIQRHPTAPTRKVYVTRSLTGERHFAGFGETPTTEFADTHLQADALPEALFSKAEYLAIGTLALAYPDSLEAVHRAMELAFHYDVQIFVDINWRPAFWMDEEAARPLIADVLEQANLIKCSEEEAEWLFGSTDAVDIYEELDSVEGVLVTAGGSPGSYCLGDCDGEIPIFPVEVKDTTGAGDGFVAGFLHRACAIGDALYEDEDAARRAIAYASAVGALTATAPGAIAAQPTADCVAAFLAQHGFSQ